MRAHFAQAHYADLRKCARRTTTSRASEGLFVLRGIRHVHHETINCHEPHAGIEGVRSIGLRLQLDHVFCQPPQWPDSHALSRLAEGRATWGARGAELSQPPKYLP